MSPVTCLVDRGLVKIAVVGDYSFDEVQREVLGALNRATFDGPWAIIYDMRSALSLAFPEEARVRAAWIADLSAQGLRACAVIVRPGSMMATAKVPVLEASGVATHLFTTAAGAEDWAKAVIVSGTVERAVSGVARSWRNDADTGG